MVGEIKTVLEELPSPQGDAIDHIARQIAHVTKKALDGSAIYGDIAP